MYNRNFLDIAIQDKLCTCDYCGVGNEWWGINTAMGKCCIAVITSI
jgi:hypothetical protein